MSALQTRLEEIMSVKGWTHADLVRESGESHSVVSQWLGKGSKEIKSIGKMQAAERLEAATGYRALWIAKGLGPPKLSMPSVALIPQGLSTQARPVSHQIGSDGPPLLSWEQVVSGEVREEFKLAIQDDAMGAEYPRGIEILWRSKQRRKVGKPVLVRDSAGQVYVRVCHEGTSPEHWLAVPANPAFRTLDSVRDGLEVIAGFRARLDPIEDD